ncbi:HTH-type transcriptional regulator CynR [Halomonas elongata]|uniref:HTH-type transcriptional regulator CynR n=1 Tax=Halomonas elongata TaxID=2746 RepID=A0A1B8P0D4_HALEL|nr:HTH-type transcriptional regulator CynR [Halomonas elongata]
MLGSYYFPPLLMGFKAQHPGIRLTVVEAGARRLQHMIASGELDLGVVIDDGASRHLARRHLTREEMVVCVPREHPFAEYDSVTPEAFFAEPLVLFQDGYFHREFIDTLSQRCGTEANIAFESNLIPLTKAIVRRGFGITTFLRRVVEEPDLAAISFDTPSWMDLSLAWAEGPTCHGRSRPSSTSCSPIARRPSPLAGGDHTAVETLRQVPGIQRTPTLPVIALPVLVIQGGELDAARGRRMQETALADVDTHMPIGTGRTEEHQIAGTQFIPRYPSSFMNLAGRGARHFETEGIGEDILHQRRTIDAATRGAAQSVGSAQPALMLGQQGPANQGGRRIAQLARLQDGIICWRHHRASGQARQVTGKIIAR